MFRAEKTMFMPPDDVSQAARILGKNNKCPQAPTPSVLQGAWEDMAGRKRNTYPISWQGGTQDPDGQ